MRVAQMKPVCLKPLKKVLKGCGFRSGKNIKSIDDAVVPAATK
jgi:hypothetical protein